jgi:hypothetical protein
MYLAFLDSSQNPSVVTIGGRHKVDVMKEHGHQRARDSQEAIQRLIRKLGADQRQRQRTGG